MTSWYKYEKKGGAKYMLKVCSGWMKIRQNKGGAMIISHYLIVLIKKWLVDANMKRNVVQSTS